MLLDQIAALSAPRDASEFGAALVYAAQDMQFGRVAAMLVTEPAVGEGAFVCVGNTPEAFASEHSDPALGKRDPVMQHARRHVTPIIYDQSTYVRARAGELWETQARFGYRTGVAVSIRLGYGQSFALGIDREEPIPEHGELRARLSADVMVLAAHASCTARRLLASIPTGLHAVKLTPRETDILTWTALGKSSWAIARLMDLSPSAVNFHLRNAMRKFDVSSRHVAASHAMRLGLINP